MKFAPASFLSLFSVSLGLLAAGCAVDAPESTAAAAADSTSDACEYPTTKARPSASGRVDVAGGSGTSHALYWTKLDAPTQPAKGTLFYLAGGPISHMLYTDMAAAFQRLAYPDLDVVLYDYYGFNCSTPIQDAASLVEHAADVTMPAMAHDFIQLKRALIGDTKAFLMGGSHGAMIGAQIVRDYAGEIDRAVLFSGDSQSGWLADGWFRFDRLMSKLDQARPGFAADLGRLLDSAAAGTLTTTIDGQKVAIDRASLEFDLWLVFSLDSSAQASLPDAVTAALGGETEWIGSIHSAALGLFAPVEAAAAPTEVSRVTNFHRCNVWFPKSQRVPRVDAQETFFHFRSFIDSWNRLCQDYDGLGEFPLAATPATPTAVPLLGWVGDQDTFDPVEDQARWAALSARSTFHVMPGWSHDFGTDPNAGFGQAVTMVKEFLAAP